MGFVALGQKCLGAFSLENNSYYDRILCCMSESKGTLKFEFVPCFRVLLTVGFVRNQSEIFVR